MKGIPFSIVIRQLMDTQSSTTLRPARPQPAKPRRSSSSGATRTSRTA